MKSFDINNIGRNALILAAFSSLVSGAALAAVGQPSIISTQYAGENLVAVRWQISESHLVTGVECGYLEISDFGYRPRGEYALFARVPGGDFEQVWDLRDTTDRMWYGSVPGLDADTPVELQILQKEYSSEDFCENSADSIALVDVTNVDNPPSYDSTDEVLIGDFQIQQSNTASSVWAEYEVQDWAQNITDGDGETQFMLNNFVYGTPYGLVVDNGSQDGQPISTLSGSTERRNTADLLDYSDGLSVLQACNVAKSETIHLHNWVGACSVEVPVIVSAGRNALGANKVPSFTMAKSLAVGTDYSMQEHLGWANNLSAGDNATTTSSLRFHTLWVTNSALYEIAPWVSYPSGSLHFKFKEGVSGSSRVYVSLADWDVNSPENINQYVNFSDYDADLTADHSMIQYVELSVGDGNDNMRSAGARGLDLSQTLATDSSATAGGGGSLGLLSLSLLMFGFKRKR